jgi:hypothetical protein
MFTKTIILAATALISSAFAAPTAQAAADNGPVSITLIDAVGHEWPIYVPADQSRVATNVKESIAHVRVNNQGAVPCAFFGIDGAIIVALPETVKYMDVGPPQTIVGGHCGPWRAW